jgi:hypothetical protein
LPEIPENLQNGFDFRQRYPFQAISIIGAGPFAKTGFFCYVGKPAFKLWWICLILHGY